MRLEKSFLTFSRLVGQARSIVLAPEASLRETRAKRSLGTLISRQASPYHADSR